MNDNIVVENTKFIAFRDAELTQVAQKELTHLYMPLIGQKSINIYITLSTLIPFGENESKSIGHLKLFQLLKINNENEFIKERNKLEAISLIEVYFNGEDFIYKLKTPLTPNEFFQNETLSYFLLQNVKEESYQNLVMDFLIHRFDISKYQNITKSFDDVYTLDNNVNINYLQELTTLVTTPTGEQIRVNNPHFDYQYLTILLNASGIVNTSLLNQKNIYNDINKYSFLYQLSTEEIKDAIFQSLLPNKDIDLEEFKKACKQIYDKHQVKPKIVNVQTSNTDNKLINYLDQTAPTEIVKTKFGVGLVGSEIEMFNKLMENTGISLGILNVLIIYVLQDKNGEVPSYNYFDKIIKTWQRMGISSTKQAIDHINGRGETQQPTKRTSNKNVKPVPEWYGEYAKDLDTKSKPNLSESDEEAMKELNELFKFEEK